MKVAFLFPGQGAQYLNMGKEFYESYPEAKEIIDHASDIVGYDLKKVLFDGPQELLTETKNAQVAIFVVSMAITAVLTKQFPSLRSYAVAGLSLGEYSALCGAKYLDFATCLQLVNKRANLMHMACEKTEGGMSVVLGLETEEVEKVVRDLKMPNDLWMANLNCPMQVAVSGTFKGLEMLAEKAKESGAKRVVPLQVHGAFHSGIMKPAQDELEPHIDDLNFHQGVCPIAMNVSGELVQDIEQIKSLLKKQITGAVHWQKSIENMDSQGIDLYLEIGPGKVLTGLNKRIGVNGKSLNIESVHDLDKLNELIQEKSLV